MPPPCCSTTCRAPARPIPSPGTRPPRRRGCDVRSSPAPGRPSGKRTRPGRPARPAASPARRSGPSAAAGRSAAAPPAGARPTSGRRSRPAPGRDGRSPASSLTVTGRRFYSRCRAPTGAAPRRSDARAPVRPSVDRGGMCPPAGGRSDGETGCPQAAAPDGMRAPPGPQARRSSSRVRPRPGASPSRGSAIPRRYHRLVEADLRRAAPPRRGAGRCRTRAARTRSAARSGS
jgi:hypothetical protein